MTETEEIDLGTEVSGYTDVGENPTIVRGKVRKIIDHHRKSVHGGKWISYIVETKDYFEVKDKWDLHGMIVEKGVCLIDSHFITTHGKWGFDIAKAIFVTMQAIHDQFQGYWNEERKDLFWYLRDLALYHLGIDKFANTAVTRNFPRKEPKQE